MNFDVLPELHWEWAYGGFWGVVILIVIALVLVMRRAKLL
jgi:Mg2+ and Co2+ transporter CorA